MAALVNIQLEVLGWVEKRNYLESAVQLNGILSDLLLQAAQRQAFFGTLEVTWDVAPVSGIAETAELHHMWFMIYSSLLLD